MVVTTAATSRKDVTRMSDGAATLNLSAALR